MTVPADRIKSGLRAFLAAELARLGHAPLFPCAVVEQHADGSLALLPDDPRFADVSGASQVLTSVRLLAPAPGVAVTVVVPAPGDPSPPRVLLAFEGNDPARPVALPAWEAGALARLDLGNATAGVARLGDSASVEMYTVGGTIYVRAPGTIPWTAVSSSAATPTALPVRITTASTKVRAE